MIKAPLLPSAPLIELCSKDRFIYNGIPYVALGYDKHGYRFQLEADHTSELLLSTSELFTALRDDQASIRYDYHTKRQTKLRLVVGDRKLEDFSTERQLIARHRENLIRLYEEYVFHHGKKPKDCELEELLCKWASDLHYENAPTTAFGELVKSKKRCDNQKTVFNSSCVKTFKRHYKEYMSCDRDVRALIPRYHGPGLKAMKIECVESLAIWREFACGYSSRTKPSKVSQLNLCFAKIHLENEVRKVDNKFLLTPPTKKKFFRLINQMDEFEVATGREGSAFAKSYYKSKMLGFDIERPGARVEFDDWKVDMMTMLTACGVWHSLPHELQQMIGTRRIWIVVAIDSATRYVLAVKATTSPTSDAVSEALQLVMSDKTYLSKIAGAKTDWIGYLRPQTVYSDNGSNYISDETLEKFRLCKIDFTRPAAGHPQRRPFIESLFATFSQEYMSSFDGRTFSNVLQKGDYDPVKCASLTSVEFMKMFIRAICDIYHLRPTAKLNGNTPHNAWVEKTAKYPISAVPGNSEMRHIFGTKVMRKITAKGVEIAGIPYNNENLQKLRRAQGGRTDFEVKFHPNSLHEISVKHPDGWISVPNTISLEPNVSMLEWKAAADSLKKRNRENVQFNLPDMYQAMNVNRLNGIAATMRAGLSPVIPSAKELQALEKELSEGRIISTDLELPKMKMFGPETAHDPLYEGNLGPLPASTNHELPDVQSNEVFEPDEHYNQF